MVTVSCWRPVHIIPKKNVENDVYIGLAVKKMQYFFFQHFISYVYLMDYLSLNTFIEDA